MAVLFLGKPTIALTNWPLNRGKWNQTSQKRRKEEEIFVPSLSSVIFEKGTLLLLLLRCREKTVWIGAEELQGETLTIAELLKGVSRVSPSMTR